MDGQSLAGGSSRKSSRLYFGMASIGTTKIRTQFTSARQRIGWKFRSRQAGTQMGNDCMTDRGTISKIANNIAEELQPMLDELLAVSDARELAKIEARIARVLWNNKVGILRVCQSRAAHR